MSNSGRLSADDERNIMPCLIIIFQTGVKTRSVNSTPFARVTAFQKPAAFAPNTVKKAL